MKKSDWPYDAIFQQPTPGLLKQELVNYRLEGDRVVKEVVTRCFYGKNDYQDSVRTEVIYAPK